MAAAVRSRKTKAKNADLARRLGTLIGRRTVAKVLKADEGELVIEFDDGTRLLVHADQRLDISVTR